MYIYRSYRKIKTGVWLFWTTLYSLLSADVLWAISLLTVQGLPGHKDDASDRSAVFHYRSFATGPERRRTSTSRMVAAWTRRNTQKGRSGATS